MGECRSCTRSGEAETHAATQVIAVCEADKPPQCLRRSEASPQHANSYHNHKMMRRESQQTNLFSLCIYAYDDSSCHVAAVSTYFQTAGPPVSLDECSNESIRKRLAWTFVVCHGFRTSQSPQHGVLTGCLFTISMHARKNPTIPKNNLSRSLSLQPSYTLLTGPAMLFSPGRGLEPNLS